MDLGLGDVYKRQELAIARSRADAPEIDGLVQIQDGAEAGLQPGQFVDVRIMGADEHDLFGLVDGLVEDGDVDATADPLRGLLQP